MTAEALNRSVAPLATPRGVYYVRLRDRAVQRLLTILEAYEMGHHQTVSMLLDDGLGLLDELRAVPGVEGAR